MSFYVVQDRNDCADMAAAALTITSMREHFINFVKPFQHLGMSVVVKRPQVPKELLDYPFTFSIFQPLEPAVWGLVTLAVVVVSDMLLTNMIL